MTFSELNNNVTAYLKSKLPDVPEHTVQEIAVHFANMATIAVNDAYMDAYGRMKHDRPKREATGALERLKRERDAAIEYIPRSCSTCKHERCELRDEPCASCNDKKKWEWRGVEVQP